VASYRGPKCRLCRREGTRLYLKGERCYTKKCSVERRRSQDGRVYPPGQHGQVPRRVSDYSWQLREKQKVRRTYGLMERQFRNYFRDALRARGVTGEVFLATLERRLDNVVYRLGFASSRREARTLVCHRHFEVNGRTTNVPSCILRPGDVVAVRQKSRKVQPITAALERSQSSRVPSWIEVDTEKLQGKILALPERSQIDTQVNEQLVVEFYSRA
jgi:small subunit ribosomal protein S4